MNFVERHIISHNTTVFEALERMDSLASDATLFVVDDLTKLVGSLTDGDIRRGLMKGKTIDDSVMEIIEQNPKYISKNNYSIEDIISFKKNNIRIIPIVNKQFQIINIINFRFHKSYLPVDAVLMAGGKGERLLPLTIDTPKPLLKVGDKPIIEHNIDNLIRYGFDDFHLSVKYLAEKIENYFGNGELKNIHIDYVKEDEPLGTIGAVANILNFKNDYILVTNSDLLTDLDYEDFFLDFIQKKADLSIMSIPYNVSVPYAIFEMDGENVLALREKPTYNYLSNAGIYLMKKDVIGYIPKNTKYNATDLIEKLIEENKKVIAYSHNGYWLDIGQFEDYKKAQNDIKHLKLE